MRRRAIPATACLLAAGLLTAAIAGDLQPHRVTVDNFRRAESDTPFARFVKNPRNAYTVNNVSAKPNADGSVTVRFGGDETAPNVLPIVPGWNHTVRPYRPRQETLDGTWKFPEAEPVK